MSTEALRESAAMPDESFVVAGWDETGLRVIGPFEAKSDAESFAASSDLEDPEVYEMTAPQSD
jgi:hypothetical protein